MLTKYSFIPIVVINPDREDEERLLKTNAHTLKAGDAVQTRTGGGGGYGSPLERDPESVREDVLDRYVSVEGAKRDYGVVLRDDLSVDTEATAALRSEMG